VLSIPLMDVLRIMIAARGDAGGIPVLVAGTGPAPPPDLMQLLGGLSEAQFAEVSALALLGSGQFTADQWPEALAEVRAAPESVDSLAALPLLGDYLLEALVELGYPREDTRG
jgi:hypothetical protein